MNGTTADLKERDDENLDGINGKHTGINGAAPNFNGCEEMDETYKNSKTDGTENTFKDNRNEGLDCGEGEVEHGGEDAEQGGEDAEHGGEDAEQLSEVTCRTDIFSFAKICSHFSKIARK